MTPQLNHPWLPRKMVLGGLPLVMERTWLVPDALFAAKELDAILSNQLPTAHQLAMSSLSWRALRLFHARNSQVAAQLARNATFAVALASKSLACHAAIL